MKKMLILFCVVSIDSQGQLPNRDSSRVYDLSTSFLYSSILTGKGSLQQFTSDHPWSAQLDFGLTKNTPQSWNYCNCYSRNGVSLAYFNLANPPKLGTAVTLSVFAEPILILQKSFTLSLRGSAGFVLMNKVYDSITNPDNIFVSSRLSYLLNLGIKAQYSINRHFKAAATFQLNHISNGGKRDPNEGMNFVGAGFSLNYVLNPSEFQKRPIQKFDDNSWMLMLHVFGGNRIAMANSYHLWNEESRPVGGLNAGVIKQIGRMNGVGVGGEIYYDGINEVNQQRSGHPIQSTVAGVSLQHYLFFGKLLFGQQLALYVTPDTGQKQSIYQRYFLEYEIKKGWFAGVTLKGHGNHSDYLAISAAHRFKLTH
ncbi:hypothetical protein WSM22_42950 [Cytophagales bacterium WSM2-2]|nr:hypothetical protein WSM22_42950 [Cytophagales bacterium WSM2-2]